MFIAYIDVSKIQKQELCWFTLELSILKSHGIALGRLSRVKGVKDLGITMETPRLRGRARPQGGGNILYLDCAGGLSGNIILQKSFNFSLEMGTVYCMQVTLQQSCLKNPSYNMTLNLEQLKSRKNMSIQFQTWHVKLQWHSPPPKFLSFFNARKLKIIISKFKHKNYNKQKGS